MLGFLGFPGFPWCLQAHEECGQGQHEHHRERAAPTKVFLVGPKCCLKNSILGESLFWRSEMTLENNRLLLKMGGGERANTKKKKKPCKASDCYDLARSLRLNQNASTLPRWFGSVTQTQYTLTWTHYNNNSLRNISSDSWMDIVAGFEISRKRRTSSRNYQWHSSLLEFNQSMCLVRGFMCRPVFSQAFIWVDRCDLQNITRKVDLCLSL